MLGRYFAHYSRISYRQGFCCLVIVQAYHSDNISLHKRYQHLKLKIRQPVNTKLLISRSQLSNFYVIIVVSIKIRSYNKSKQYGYGTLKHEHLGPIKWSEEYIIYGPTNFKASQRIDTGCCTTHH